MKLLHGTVTAGITLKSISYVQIVCTAIKERLSVRHGHNHSYTHIYFLAIVTADAYTAVEEHSPSKARDSRRLPKARTLTHSADIHTKAKTT